MKNSEAFGFGRLTGGLPPSSKSARWEGGPLCLEDWRGVGPRVEKDVLGLWEGDEAAAGGFLEGGGLLLLGISQRWVCPSSLAILQSLKKCYQAV